MGTDEPIHGADFASTETWRQRLAERLSCGGIARLIREEATHLVADTTDLDALVTLDTLEPTPFRAGRDEVATRQPLTLTDSSSVDWLGCCFGLGVVSVTFGIAVSLLLPQPRARVRSR